MFGVRTTVHQWGSTGAERSRTYAAQELLPTADVVLHRAVDVAAPAAIAYRWLCQLKVAPYSYDWIDNLGRRSPRQLTPGADVLEVGERFMPGFRIAAFEPGCSITIRSGTWLCMTYEVVPVTEASCRLLGVLAMRQNAAVAELLAWGDLVMMRKQLRTIAALAEQQGRSVGTDPAD